MYYRVLAICGLVASAFGQQNGPPSLLDALESSPDLSRLLELVNLVPWQKRILQKISGNTILAPTNVAFEAVDPNSPTGRALASGDRGDADALISYHLLAERVPSNAATEVPAFVPTYLNNAYVFQGLNPAEEVSGGGQKVGIVANGDNVQILSGGLAVSTVTEAVRNTNPAVLSFDILKFLLGYRGSQQYSCP